MNCEFLLRARPAACRMPAAAGRPVILPPHAPGMRIGLFGGTFDPPHAAHRAACLLAMRRLGLDRVWWLVTPGNPLKDTHGLAPLAERIAAARALAHHPRIDVTDFEADLGTSYTYATISYLVRALPRRAFRLDHGRRQSASLPSLAALARHRAAGADRGRRSARAEPLFGRRRRRTGAGARAASRNGGKDLAAAQAAGLGLSARPEIAAVLDGAARRAKRKRLNDSCLTAKELKLLTCRAYLKGPRISVAGAEKERKDKQPCPQL